MSSSTSSSEIPRFWPELSPRRFLCLSGIGCAVTLGLVWLWVAAMPLAFLDPEYPFWRAKRMLLESCDLGEILILGDSRAATGMMPALWPVRAANLAVGGGEAIEALAALTRATRCPAAPRQIILSIDAGHVTRPDLFWERTARFGFVDSAEIALLREVSHALGDTSVYEARHTDGLPSLARDLLYRARFPSLWFASLVKGGVFLRHARNQAALEAGIASRGHYFFGTASGSGIVAAEGHMRDFRPLPVLDWYFDQILAHARARGIPVLFVAMPMNAATAAAVDPGARAGFRSWLAGYEARYPGFQVAGAVMPHWPDAFFGDGFSHLNPEGAARFNAGFSLCLRAARLTLTHPRHPPARPGDLSRHGADGPVEPGHDEEREVRPSQEPPVPGPGLPLISAACVQRLQEAPPSTQKEAQ